MSAIGANMLVWLDATHRDLAQEIVRKAGVRVAAVGSHDPSVSGDLAERFGTQRAADLRVASQQNDVDTVLLTTAGEDAGDDLQALLQSGLRTLTVEPVPDSLANLAEGNEAYGSVYFAPLMRRSPGFRAATDVIATFGEPRCVSVFFRCGKGQGSMFARLYDAMDILSTLCGQPEQIDAALAGPVPGLPGVPEALRGLHGSMTINLRFPQNRCACVAVSDQAGAWFRGVTVLGERGCLRIHDDGFEWIDEDGAKVDSSLAAQPLNYAELVADQLIRLLERRDHAELPIDHGKLLALCEAARLSCRTGQSETPRKILELLSRV